MSEFNPVESKDDLDTLDQEDIVAGYRFGWNCADEPGSDKSRGFWHGWRNAQADKGRIPIDDAMHKLAVEILGCHVGYH